MKKQNRLIALTAAVSLITGLILGAGAVSLINGTDKSSSGSQNLQTLYASAIKDAAFAEPEEILPLVSLTRDDPLVTWDEDGERVLLCTWHNDPESYPSGETVTLDQDAVWTFTPDELAQRYKAESGHVSDWDLRLKQLIGLPPDSEYSAFTTFWADPADICRPACQTDPANGEMQTALDRNSVPESYAAWFNENILYSYFYDAYPWTRLGYTYDWADNGSEYGLSEFLVRQGAKVEVVDTRTTEAFLEQLD